MAAGVAGQSVAGLRPDGPMFASREAEQFFRGLAEPAAVQRTILLDRIIGPNADCEFGRRHDFASIRSEEDFRRAVPIRRYDGFDPWVDRIVHGEQGVLTSEPVKRFFMTSGSTAKAKYIPVTRSFIQTKSRAFGIYWSRVFDDHPQAKEGPMVTNFSDSGKPVKSPGGLPCGSESSYWASVTRATQLAKRPVVPKAVAQIGDADARYYAIARILLEESFRVIMTLNPSTIVLLLKKLQDNAAELAQDIERGSLTDRLDFGDAVRKEVDERYSGDPERAARVRELSARPRGATAHDLWPQLALAICWRSPMLQPYIDLLAPHFGTRIAQRDYMMMASEGIMALPLRDGQSGGVCGVGLHYYEFIPEESYDDAGREQPDVLAPHELQTGQRYVVVLTNGSGLYRYDIGDVVRVVGFEQKTPIVEFLHRAGRTSSLTGEKLTEDQVTAAVRAVAQQLALTVESFTLAPAQGGFPHYVALVEFKDEPAVASLRRFPQHLDEALERENVEYGSKRSSQRLAAPELWVVQRGEFEARRRERLAGGTSDSQIKPTHLSRDPAVCDEYEVGARFAAE